MATPQITVAKEQNKKPEIGKISAWKGKTKSDLENHPKYGRNPSETVANKDGTTTVTYRQVFDASGSVEEDKVAINLNCRRSFTYDSKNKIITASEIGNCQDTPAYLPSI